MKIAVMTWFHFNNYGTVLQAAAITRVLKKMGHEAEIIDYFPGDRVLSMPTESVRYELMQKVRERRRAERNPEIISRVSGEQFDSFREQELVLTRYCETLSDLESLNSSYDAFLCGSDRIWLPEHFDPHYYLDFVENPSRMIAYAPSILEIGRVDKHVMQKMEQLISRFSHLSVREEDGRKYLDRAFGEKTLELADPVLLVEADEWEMALELPGEEKKDPAGYTDPADHTGQADPSDSEDHTGPADHEDPADEKDQTDQTDHTDPTGHEDHTGQPEHYLLICFQGGNRSYYDAARKLASRLGLEIKTVPVHALDLNEEGVIKEGVGPYQLLGLVRNADYVCTDSYHTMLLSITFHREFCCFEQFTERSKLGYNARVWHILNALGLKSRLYDNNAPLEQYLETIDYIPVEYKLDALKFKSRAFLQEALDQIQGEVQETQVSTLLHVREGYSLCSGCGACTAVCPQQAIAVSFSPNGFFEASVDENRCARCGRCIQVCPFHAEVKGNRMAEGKLLSYRDEEAAMCRSASGGGLAGRLASVLHNNGYAVAGCSFDEIRQKACHILIRSEDDASLLSHLQGSKYLQSDLSGFWEEIRSVEGPLAFFGTPCQVAGVKRVLHDRTDVRYIEIVCGGVPSYLLFEKYKKTFRGRNRMNEDTFELSVRYRQVPQNGRYIRVSDGNIEKLIPIEKDPYSRMIDSREFLCQACYDCRWRSLSEADLRIGDYRNGRKGFGWSDEQDCSSVFCMNETGKAMLDEMMIAGFWEGLKKRDIVAYLAENGSDNPPKPVFYEELAGKFGDDKVSLHRILNEYVRTFEKRNRWERLT